jgi:hypothetical protein
MEEIRGQGGVILIESGISCVANARLKSYSGALRLIAWSIIERLLGKMIYLRRGQRSCSEVHYLPRDIKYNDHVEWSEDN